MKRIFKNILLINIMISIVLYSENTRFKEKSINLVEQKKMNETREENLEYIFNNIREKNNKIVLAFLNTSENRKIVDNLEEKKNEESRKKEDYSSNLLEEIYREQKQGLQNILIDVNSRNKEGYTPIIVAIESGNNEILKVLLENGANIREKHPVFGLLTLHTACYYENYEAAEILLKKDPSLVNVRSGYDGWTPLQDATLKSNYQIVKLLLKYGANPTIKDNNGGTAIDMATEFGKGEIVKLLRDNVKEKWREN